MMNKVKQYGLFCLLLLFGGCVFGQQDAMFSQYMFNPLSVNPAYAGSRDMMSFNALARFQWVGLGGAPITQSFSFHMPTETRRSGFGINVMNDKISYIGQTWVNLSYAYRIHLTDKARLALGLSGTFYNYRIDWNQSHLIDPNDFVANNYSGSLNLPNAGFGMYFHTDKAYIGVSVPHLLINSLDANRAGIKVVGGNDAGNNLALLKRHFFATGGYVFDLSREVQFKPSFFYKYVYGAPMEMDINANLYFHRKFGVGASYRTGDGIVAMVEFQFTNQLKAGYAYDYPFTDLNRYTWGSHELMIGFDFGYKNSAVVSPRVF